MRFNARPLPPLARHGARLQPDRARSRLGTGAADRALRPRWRSHAPRLRELELPELRQEQSRSRAHRERGLPVEHRRGAPHSGRERWPLARGCHRLRVERQDERGAHARAQRPGELLSGARPLEHLPAVHEGLPREHGDRCIAHLRALGESAGADSEHDRPRRTRLHAQAAHVVRPAPRQQLRAARGRSASGLLRHHLQRLRGADPGSAPEVVDRPPPPPAREPERPEQPDKESHRLLHRPRHPRADPQRGEGRGELVDGGLRQGGAEGRLRGEGSPRGRGSHGRALQRGAVGEPERARLVHRRRARRSAHG